MARSWRYDVFPSFSGEDVRKSFLSHLLEKLKSKLIISFIDHGIERSRPIGPELLSAIRDSRISIVVFSKTYASSTWCLNELAEIHKCYKELDLMVIPVFYELDPSEVRKQSGDFGKAFEKTCEGKPEDDLERWKKALTEVASIAGEDSRNWSDEAKMIEQISNDVSNKLFTPSDDFGDFVGVGAHIEAIMDSALCLESGGVRMVGILGPSGIGKSTIARALFNRLSRQFDHRAFVSYKRTIQEKTITIQDDHSMKLRWANQFLSEILGQKDIKIESLGAVEQRLKNRKVLIVLDDVDEIELLETLAGRTGWFGFGSRIVVVTQDRALLKSHEIDLIYEVEFPSERLALQMFCQSAFRQTSPPDDFMDLAPEVATLAGNLPLGLNVLGLSLRGKDKEEWVEMIPRLRKNLNGKIEKTLKVSYDGLDAEDQEIFLYIACLLNGHKVKYIRDVLGDRVNLGLMMLNDKSLLRITSSGKTVEMHNLLQMLGREIVRGESIYNPGKRRFLVDAEDICDVFNDNMGTETVLGICFNTSEINGPLFLDENSFQGMYNLRFLKIYNKQLRKSDDDGLYLPQGLVYLPRKLRILYWDECPLKSMPSNFKAEFLVKFRMKDSKLDKLWEGTQQLRNLKAMNIGGSRNLKEIPDLSYAINLKKMDLLECTSLVTLPSSIRHLKKLLYLRMAGCTKLEVLPADVNLESLQHLDLIGCSRLRSFPTISKNLKLLILNGIAMEEESSQIEINDGFVLLHWRLCPLRCLPSNFCPEALVSLRMRKSKLETLWEGVQSLGNLSEMDLSGSKNLKEIPNLSKATKLRDMIFDGCKSLETVPCSIQGLNKLKNLSMRGCTGLKSLPTNLNLKSLGTLNLSGCSQLNSFPQISRNIRYLLLDHTAIEEVPSWIKFFSELTRLDMGGCKRLKNVSPNIFELEKLENVDFSDCEGVTMFGDAGVMTRISGPKNGVSKFFFYHSRGCLNFDNCFNLDQNAQKLIIESNFKYTVVPGGEVPKFFTHRASESSLTIPLHERSLFKGVFGLKVCIVLEPPTVTKFDLPCIEVRWYFRGKSRVHQFLPQMSYLKMDHLFVFHFGFNTEEGIECPSELDLGDAKFEFYYRMYGCRHSFLCDPPFHTEACSYSVQKIKGCGIELWHVSPSRNDRGGENFQFYRGSLSSSDEEDTESLGAEDNESLPSSDEEEDSDRHLTDDEELDFSSFFDDDRVDDPLCQSGEPDDVPPSQSGEFDDDPYDAPPSQSGECVDNPPSQLVFELEDLMEASGQVLGKGAFGTSFVVLINAEILVVVKRLEDVTTADREFTEKIETVVAMDHENLVPLIAYSYSEEQKLLVYEFMPTGSLSALLHVNEGVRQTPVDWEIRLRIALGAARGLNYLHSQDPLSSHGNIKSSNILLTNSHDARVSDFGVAQIVGSSRLRLTGYCAPEVTEPEHVSQKADVFSFGVVLLELLTGIAPFHSMNEEGMDLARWAHSVDREEWWSEVFLPDLMSLETVGSLEGEMVEMLQLGIECTEQDPDKRPVMVEVVRRIQELHQSGSDQVS